MSKPENLLSDYIHRAEVDDYIRRFTEYKERQTSELVRLIREIFSIQAIWDPIKQSYEFRILGERVRYPNTVKISPSSLAAKQKKLKPYEPSKRDKRSSDSADTVS